MVTTESIPAILFESIEFLLSEIVYLKTDSEQNARMVTGISIRPNGITYALANGATESWHYGIEINREKDVLKQIT